MHHSKAWVGAVNVALSMIHVSVSVANNFVHSSTAADQGYDAFGEFARFVYCVLQKIKKASSLPLVEQREEYVVPNHSRLPAIDDKNFLVGTRVMAALGKVGSHYLQKESRRDARRVLRILKRWLFIILGFVLDVRLHSFLANILMDHLCLFKNVLGTLRGRNGLLLWANVQFQIQYVVRNSAVKDSAWLTANTRVTRCIII